MEMWQYSCECATPSVGTWLAPVPAPRLVNIAVPRCAPVELINHRIRTSLLSPERLGAWELVLTLMAYFRVSACASTVIEFIHHQPRSLDQQSWQSLPVCVNLSARCPIGVFRIRQSTRSENKIEYALSRHLNHSHSHPHVNPCLASRRLRETALPYDSYSIL